MRVASGLKRRMISVSGVATAPVGRVSPRPQNRGRNCTLLGREPLREAKAFGLTGRWVAGDPAVSERPALPPRSPDRYLKLTPVGNCRSATEINDESKESARKICGPIIYPHNNCAKADS
jgi:hypothetical protein